MSTVPSRIVAVALAATLIAVGLFSAGPARADEDSGKLELVLDSSGSMKEPAGGGQTKIQAAKKALHSVVDGLPAGSNVGMRVYGATVENRGDPGACTDSQQVVDIGPVDKPALHAEIDSYKPYGETPIAYSLKQAAKDLGSKGKRSIVLVSDGEETCDEDPCLISRHIAGKGIDLTIDVVGLNVTAKARKQLQCIADEGNGSYVDARDAEDLEASLGKLSTRAFREFSVGGKPVEGSKAAGSATEITPGRYATTIDAENGRPEYFAVTKTPGSSLWVAATARPPRAGEDRQELAVLINSPDGRCQTTETNYTVSERLRPVFVAETMVDARRPKTQACAEADQVLVGIAGKGVTGSRGGWSVELVITEEPPVESVSGLPKAEKSLSTDHESRWKGASKATKVVGGTGFSDAPELKPGAYADTIVPGERLLYKVPADFGQRVIADVRIPKVNPATAKAMPKQRGDRRGLALLGQLYGPGYGTLTKKDNDLGVQTLAQGEAAASFRLQTPQIRYLNRTDDDTYRASAAGYYYVEIDAQEDAGQTYTVPLQLRIAVQGSAGSGAPEDAGSHRLQPGNASESSAPEPSAQPSTAPSAEPSTEQPSASSAAPSAASSGTASKPASNTGAPPAGGPTTPEQQGLPGWVFGLGAAGLLVIAGLAATVVVLARRR